MAHQAWVRGRQFAVVVTCNVALALPAAATPVMSGLISWLDANDAATMSLTGSSVTQWRDKSGNGNHVNQAASAAQPTYTAGYTPNGSAAIVFDGANDIMPYVQGPTLTQFSLFIVWNQISVPGGYGAGDRYPLFIGSGDINAPGRYMAIEIGQHAGADPNVLDIIGGYDNDSRATLAGIAATGAVRTMSATSSNTADTQVWLNGQAASMSTTGSPTAWNFTLGNASGDGPLGLGGLNWPSQNAVLYNNVAISAVLIYDRVLTTNERRQTEDFLAAEYGVNVPEPATGALLAMGVLSVVFGRRMRARG